MLFDCTGVRSLDRALFDMHVIGMVTKQNTEKDQNRNNTDVQHVMRFSHACFLH